MSARGFGSILWAGAVAGAALGFYLVSLNVASERAELEQVETSIAMTQRDIRLLQTEIGTRGRLAQLERWNVKFIRLSAPSADQFVEGGFHLASLVRPDKRPAIEAPVVLASATIDQAVPQTPRLTGDAVSQPGSTAARSAGDMMHVASYAVPAAAKAAPGNPSAGKPLPDGADSGKAATHGSASKPARAATKPAKSATADPLAPLPSTSPKAKAGSAQASAGGFSRNGSMLKDRVTDR